MPKPKYPNGLPDSVIADPDVVEWAKQYRWYIYTHGRSMIPYVRRAYRPIPGGPSRVVFLHREVTGAKSDEIVDHINGNSLDNRRCNLRILDRCGNMQNRVRIPKNNKSGVRGVTWSKPLSKWKCTAQANHKQYHLGYFDSLEKAEAVVRSWRRENMPYSMEIV